MLSCVKYTTLRLTFDYFDIGKSLHIKRILCWPHDLCLLCIILIKELAIKQKNSATTPRLI